MWSWLRSAFVPSCVITAPFTVTRPSTINCSALRRLAMPACARIFCSLSSGIFLDRLLLGIFRRTGIVRSIRFANIVRLCFRFFHGRLPFRLLSGRGLRLALGFSLAQCELAEFLKLFQRRQLAEVLESELNQEFLGGLIKNRPSNHVLAS